MDEIKKLLLEIRFTFGLIYAMVAFGTFVGFLATFSPAQIHGWAALGMILLAMLAACLWPFTLPLILFMAIAP